MNVNQIERVKSSYTQAGLHNTINILREKNSTRIRDWVNKIDNLFECLLVHYCNTEGDIGSGSMI